MPGCLDRLSGLDRCCGAFESYCRLGASHAHLPVWNQPTLPLRAVVEATLARGTPLVCEAHSGLQMNIFRNHSHASVGCCMHLLRGFWRVVNR